MSVPLAESCFSCPIGNTIDEDADTTDQDGTPKPKKLKKATNQLYWRCITSHQSLTSTISTIWRMNGLTREMQQLTSRSSSLQYWGCQAKIRSACHACCASKWCIFQLVQVSWISLHSVEKVWGAQNRTRFDQQTYHTSPPCCSYSFSTWYVFTLLLWNSSHLSVIASLQEVVQLEQFGSMLPKDTKKCKSIEKQPSVTKHFGPEDWNVRPIPCSDKALESAALKWLIKTNQVCILSSYYLSPMLTCGKLYPITMFKNAAFKKMLNIVSWSN